MAEAMSVPTLVFSSMGFERCAQDHLDNAQLGRNLLLFRSAGVADRFSGIDTVYSDADGTLVPEGAISFPETVVEHIGRLASVGVRTLLVTGKPLSEVSGLADSLPKGHAIDFIFEKGAYILERNSDGSRRISPLLVSDEDTLAVQALKELFVESKSAIENQFAARMTLGWGGHGTHQSMLSIDVLRGTPPKDYLQKTGPERDALKVKDAALLRDVSVAVAQFVREYTNGWNFVDLGNANFEIAPGPIEKDTAIRTLECRRGSEAMLILGDSANDNAMFGLRQHEKMQVTTGLVLHRQASLPLVDKVDCVSFGMANASPHMNLLYAARKHLSRY